MDIILKIINAFFPIFYIKGVYLELQTWLWFYKQTSKPDVTKALEERGFDIDWVGRPYKIIKIPEKYRSYKDGVVLYMTDLLKRDDESLLKYDITKIGRPVWSKVKYKNAEGGWEFSNFAYQMWIEPPTDYLSFKIAIINLLWYSFLYSIIYGIFVVI